LPEGLSTQSQPTCQWYPVEDEYAGGSGAYNGPGDMGVCLDRCYGINKGKYNGNIDCTAINYVTTCDADSDGGDDDDDDDSDGDGVGDEEEYEYEDEYEGEDYEYENGSGGFDIENDYESCSTTEECNEGNSTGTYCASTMIKKCLPIGSCSEVSDCNNRDNQPYFVAMCVGTLICNKGRCGMNCDENDNDGGGSDIGNDLDGINNDKCRSNADCTSCVRTPLTLPEGLSTTSQPTCQWYPVDDYDNTGTADAGLLTVGGNGGTTHIESSGVCLDRCYDTTNEEENENNGGIDCTAIKYVDICDADRDQQNSLLCQGESQQLNCEECIQTKLYVSEFPTLTKPTTTTCQWFPAADVTSGDGSEEIGASVIGGSCYHKCKKKNGGYDCGVTMMCGPNPPPTLPNLPQVGDNFPQYGPPSSDNGNKIFTGKEVKELLLAEYPGLIIFIIDNGTSYVTADVIKNRVRIFVKESNGIDDDLVLEERDVARIPVVG